MNKKYLLSIVVLVFTIVGFLAFTPASKVVEHVKEKKAATPTWYQYTGAQTQLARQNKANYIRHLDGEPSCSLGSINECAVLLKDDFGPNASSASITFDGTTGMPTVAGDVSQNKTKAL